MFNVLPTFYIIKKIREVIDPKNELRKVQAASDAQHVVYEFQDNRIFEVNVVYFCTKYVTSESEISKEWINLGKDFSVHFNSNE